MKIPKFFDKETYSFITNLQDNNFTNDDILDGYTYIQEISKINTPENSIKNILSFIGEDPDREGLKDTPKRYMKFLTEFLKPKEIDFNLTTFSSENYNEMIVEKNIPFYSLCEHHLAPFFGTATIAYIPKDSIVGLSKLPRVLDHFSNRLQNQERITKNVAEFLFNKLDAVGVGVIIEAEHLCMAMRGVKKSGVTTITSCLKGSFYDDINCRNEFLQLSRK